MTPGSPSLLPPARRPDPGLPSWTLPAALLGVAILLVSTLPALVALRRLQRAERTLTEEIARMTERTERTHRDRRAVVSDEFVIERSVRDLFDPGLRLGAGRTAPPGPAVAR